MSRWRNPQVSIYKTGPKKIKIRIFRDEDKAVVVQSVFRADDGKAEVSNIRFKLPERAD